MFTSRAEYRILLRQDNADLRLTPKSHEIGLASADRMRRVDIKQKEISGIDKFLSQEGVTPEEMNGVLEDVGSSPLKQQVKAKTIVPRPGFPMAKLAEGSPSVARYFDALSDIHGAELAAEIMESAEILIKYEGYIEKEQEMADKLLRLEKLILKDNFDYSKVSSLSYEAREKLAKICPKTIGQASRISGVSPSDISVLMIHVAK
jgi:tRNA uridine 5-carboxymethylaminomethyl modification enzyme